MLSVTVRFGSEVFLRSYDTGATIANVLSDHDLKIAAGFGDNVRACVNSVEMPNNSPLVNGSTVVIETRANSKAS